MQKNTAVWMEEGKVEFAAQKFVSRSFFFSARARLCYQRRAESGSDTFPGKPGKVAPKS
jgi:hypothetical protein